MFDWTAPTGSTAYVADGLNRYGSVGGVTFGYDANGNLTSDGQRTFAYDIENRLTNVSGSVSMQLDYDPLGRLRRTVSGATTLYLYDGDRLLAEYDGSLNVMRRYVHGPGVDEPIVWYEGAGLTDKRWLHSDERGSIIATSDAAGAATVYKYGPFGEPSAWSGSRFRYTGQIALPEVQLYHYKARAYDPNLGRFLQTDPIGYGDDSNLYAYVGNDPLNKTDPLGLADYDCSSPGKGNCDLSAKVSAGDTIKYGGNTYNISAVNGRQVTFSVDTATSTGREQTAHLSLSGLGSPQGAEGLVSSAAGAASLPAAAAEHGAGKTRVGSNGRIYRENPATGRVFNGNRSVSTTSVAKIGAAAGRAAAGVGFEADTKLYRSGRIGGDEYAVNTGVGLLGLFGGPVGGVAAGTDLSEFLCSRHIMTYRSRYAEKEEVRCCSRGAVSR